MPNIGAPELIILLLITGVIVAPIVGVFTLIDIARRPEAAFVAAGQSRTTWLVIAVLSVVVPCVWFASVYYLLAVRPKLATRS